MGRRSAVVAVTLLTASLVLPAAAIGVDDGAAEPLAVDAVGDGDDDIEGARRRLGDARGSLSEVEASVRRTRDEVAMLDARLTAATTELARVTDDLASAQVALEDARIAELTAGTELADAHTALDDALGEWGRNRELLQRRAIHSFKHGRGGTQDLLVRGIAGADDWHAIAVTLETASRLAEDDQHLVADSVELTHATAELRADAGRARRHALETTRAATEEERRVAALLDRHEAAVVDVDTERTERARVLGELEADSVARAALVADLERRVADLERAARPVFVAVQVDLDVHGPAPAWADRLPAAGRPYAAMFEAIGARHGIDGRLIAALVWAESNFRPDAVSHAGAIGLAQLMPGTARGLGVDPWDPIQNVEGGTRYLRDQLDRFGSIELALAAYNAGPGRVARVGGIPNIVETQLYVVRVLDLYEQLSR